VLLTLVKDNLVSGLDGLILGCTGMDLGLDSSLVKDDLL